MVCYPLENCGQIGKKKMQDEIESVHVSLPHGGGYPILIEWGCIDRFGSLLRRYSIEGEAFLLSDKTVWELYGAALEAGLEASGYRVLERLVLEPGEGSKSLEHWTAALDRLVALEDGTAHSVFLVNLGGGVVGDIGGFVAASYRRGIPCVQVPTSLLAQVDSSVGGKTGVNHPGGKNLIGAFYQPRLVVADLRTLKTLDAREVRSGLAEVVKYGLIWDASLFSYLEENFLRILDLQEEALRKIVRTSCEVKAAVVGRDEKEEKGIRTLLNLGHTFGHALEAATDYKRYTHGEAVAVGTLCAAWISVALDMLPAPQYDRILSLFEGIGLRTRVSEADTTRLWEAMKRDKKFIHGRNRFVLLDEIGKARVVEDIDPSILEQALQAHLER
ncbi:MAG: 3-dehydroquinate synthase [Thermodesulfobacteriota bacterium]